MTTVDDNTEPADDGTGQPDPARRRWRHPVLLGAIALLVAAVAVAVWFGVAWIQAGNDPSLTRAKARDEVSRVAEQSIITFHTLDYRNVDEGLSRWEAASVGPLHDEVIGRRQSSKQAIEAAKTVTTGAVKSLAVTDLNEFEGTATVIAAVEVTVTPDGKQPERKFLRIQGSLQRTGDGWKLSGIGPVDFARS
jgi:Mce-associated membrane protein